MAKKLVEIQALNTIGHNGTDYMPGQTLAVDTKEAERLIGLGAACYPAANEPAQEPTPVNNDIMAAIAAAVTVDELLALMPANKPAAEVVAAFEARMQELGQQ